jgi:hypothetical protein
MNPTDHIDHLLTNCRAGALFTLAMGGFHGDRAVVKLIFRRDLKVATCKGKTPYQFTHQGEKADDLALSDVACTLLNREFYLTGILNHANLHKPSGYDRIIPALFFQAPSGVLGELRDEYASRFPYGRGPFDFDANFPTNGLGSGMWYKVVKQLAAATLYLEKNEYAHVNLNPYTILFHGDHKLLNCWITDYGSICDKNTVVNDWRQVVNSKYTLPYDGFTAEHHAKTQLLSTAIDLLRFDAHTHSTMQRATPTADAHSKHPNMVHIVADAMRHPDSLLCQKKNSLLVNQRKRKWSQLTTFDLVYQCLMDPTALTDEPTRMNTEKVLENLLNTLCSSTATMR